MRIWLRIQLLFLTRLQLSPASSYNLLLSTTITKKERSYRMLANFRTLSLLGHLYTLLSRLYPTCPCPPLFTAPKNPTTLYPMTKNVAPEIYGAPLVVQPRALFLSIQKTSAQCAVSVRPSFHETRSHTNQKVSKRPNPRDLLTLFYRN